jgi:hypothetical protein
VEHFSGPRLISFQDANLASRAHTGDNAAAYFNTTCAKKRGNEIKIKKEAFTSVGYLLTNIEDLILEEHN